MPPKCTSPPIDIFCTPEHNLDTHQHHFKQNTYETAQQFFDHTKLTLCSSGIPSTSTFKPGRTLMTMQGATQARIMNAGTDLFRWWAYQTFVCKIINSPLSWLTNPANKATHKM